MSNLATPVENLAFVGPKNLPRLKRLGIKTVRDLLWHFPARYEDFSEQIKIADIKEKGQVVSTMGEVIDIKTTTAWKRRMTITDVTIADETDSIHAIWFNQPYLERTLPAGTLVSLSGKVALDKKGLYLSNPSYEKLSSEETKQIHTGRLVPVYPETEGVTSKYLRLLISRALTKIPNQPETLPLSLIEKYNLPALNQALKTIHFPEAQEQVANARRRFAFEELLLFQLKALTERRQLQALKAPLIEFDQKLIADFVKSLPFILTNDQKIASYEILQDLGRPYPMNRLLNGDVGSGKTLVSLIAAYQTIKAGYQVAFMAPTEILAQQHFATLRLLSANTGISIGLLTGSEARQWPSDEITEEKISKPLMHKKIAQGEINLVIGTHAVIQKTVDFKNLGLVIIDEQHRFGVEQRMKLVKKQTTNNNQLATVPHLLSMTATPIPRTLALTIYGDLDLSLIKEKPKNRQKIITRVVTYVQRASAHRFIKQQVEAGRQVFVICPRIEISNNKQQKTNNQQLTTSLMPDKPLSQAKLVWAEVKAVTEEYKKLSEQIFPELRVAMLHGKLKPAAKTEIMQQFKAGQYDILVSTSVVEVGVDVPNATIMLIESAERFGLSQLHQFRGRVGRGEHQSYCLLFASDDSSIGKRLKSLEQTDNGFALAELDLKLRGPGQFTGVQQSGLPDLVMASLADVELIKTARLEAKLLLKEDPEIKKHPLLRVQLERFQNLIHFE